MYYYVHKMIVCIYIHPRLQMKRNENPGKEWGTNTPPKTTAPPSITSYTSIASYILPCSRHVSLYLSTKHQRTLNNLTHEQTLSPDAWHLSAYSPLQSIYSHKPAQSLDKSFQVEVDPSLGRLELLFVVRPYCELGCGLLVSFRRVLRLSREVDRGPLLI